MNVEDYDFSAMLHDNLGEDSLQHSWTPFGERQLAPRDFLGFSYGYRPDKVRLNIGNERSIMASVLMRIAIDVANLKYRHAEVDQNGSFLKVVDSSLNRCLNIEANIDQPATAFMLDAALSLMDEGVIAIVPTVADRSIEEYGAFQVEAMRVGRIVEWYPRDVKIDLYDDRDGDHKQVVLKKSSVAIVENPLSTIMNDRNSTLQRLIRKLNDLDQIDSQLSSGKIDLIFQFPYQAASKSLQEKAKRRMKDIEDQAANSKYGFIWADGTEKVTQLNRPVENTILSEIEYHTNLFYNQLGITTAILDGTADESAMINYQNRTVYPMANAFTEAMTRSFISKTGITQGKRVMVLTDPFKLSPVSQIAEIADRFTRNEILSSNEVRAIIGREPSNDPRADQLINKNIRQPDDGQDQFTDTNQTKTEERRDSK